MSDDTLNDLELIKALAHSETLHPLVDGRRDLSSREPRSTDFILSGWVPTGFCTFAGDSGTGKTSAVFPMALAAAGLIKDGYGFPPVPFERRQVIYHSEDEEQLKRMLELLKGKGLIEGDVDEWLTVVPAQRLSIDKFLQDFDGTQLLPLRTTCDRDGQKLELSPLIVFDTYQECFALNDENNNSEVGHCISSLKKVLKDVTDGVWIVAHTAKGSRQGRVRGASAIEGVVNQTFSVIRRGKQIWMEVGKNRSELRARKVVLRPFRGPVELTDRWGYTKPEWVTVSFPDIPTEEELAAAESDRAESLLEAAKEALKDGPIGKTKLVNTLKGRRETKISAIDGWIKAGILVGERRSGTEMISLPE